MDERAPSHMDYLLGGGTDRDQLKLKSSSRNKRSAGRNLWVNCHKYEALATRSEILLKGWCFSVISVPGIYFTHELRLHYYEKLPRYKFWLNM